MKINKEKLIKYIRDNFVNAKVLHQNYEGTLIRGLEINTKNGFFHSEYIDNKYLLLADGVRIPLRGKLIGKHFSPTDVKQQIFEITEDTYNELMKFTDKNLTPETQEFYKQICDNDEK